MKMLVGCDPLLLRNFKPYEIIFINVCCHNICRVNAFKGIRALWHNIYDYVCSLHLTFPSVLTGNLHQNYT
jgi:hypothetical protein